MELIVSTARPRTERTPLVSSSMASEWDSRTMEGGEAGSELALGTDFPEGASRDKERATGLHLPPPLTAAAAAAAAMSSAVADAATASAPGAPTAK